MLYYKCYMVIPKAEGTDLIRVSSNQYFRVGAK